MRKSRTDGDTKQRVYDAAAELFFYYGYAGASTRQLADAAQVNVATIYHHFGSKQLLLLAIMDQTLNKLHRRALAVMERGLSPGDQVYELARAHVLTHCSDPWACAVTDREVNSLPVRERARTVELRDRYEEKWDIALQAGLQSGDFDITDVAITRIALLSMLSDVSRWFTPFGRLECNEVAHRFAGYALRLVLPHGRAGGG